MFREFAKYKTKPIVGLVKDALSLGYWAAVECCDYIMMDGNVSSRVGSIGVVASFRDNTKLLEDAGIKIHEIYPPESNFKNKDFADAREGNYEGLIKNSLSPLAKKFQASVRDNRPNLVEDKSIGVLNGAVFYAEKALELGLIDSIGDTRMAIQKARELALSYAVNKSLI
jgi:protease-4